MWLAHNNDCSQDFTMDLKVESRTVIVTRPWQLLADIILKYRYAKSTQRWAVYWVIHDMVEE